MRDKVAALAAMVVGSTENKPGQGLPCRAARAKPNMAMRSKKHITNMQLRA